MRQCNYNLFYAQDDISNVSIFSLYRMEIGGIRALCRIVLGKKKNVLRDRVESHEYMNRQLFLATLTFAVLLFLLPTILVYYVVFATVSHCLLTRCNLFVLITRFCSFALLSTACRIS